MRANRFVPVLIALACSNAHASPGTSVPPVNQPAKAQEATLERLADGYRNRSPEAVIATMTADFRFHTRGDSLMEFFSGMSREDEARMVHGMLHGSIHDGDTLMPPADSVGMVIDGISEGVDPEHPDSTQHYEVLTVRRFEMAVRLHTGEHLLSTSALHVFHVVRGDAAVRAPGQPADSTRWYVRRWLEDVSGVNSELAGREGGCGEEPAPTPGPRSRSTGTPALPTVLAVHALTNPACAKLEVRCDLPGREPARVDVYDVSGRLVNRRDIEIAAAGTMTIEAGRGARLNPGVYWVRVGQGLRTPVTRMVVVAR